jgi:hypothetical protein
MNRRIKEIAGQVERYISTTNFEGMPEDEMTYDEIFQKKFAELIIRTCIAKCDDLNSMKYIADHFDIKFEFDWMK